MRRQQEEAFVAFANAAKPWLLTGDPHTAEDLVQETLVRSIRRGRASATNSPPPTRAGVLANLHTDRSDRNVVHFRLGGQPALDPGVEGQDAVTVVGPAGEIGLVAVPAGS